MTSRVLVAGARAARGEGPASLMTRENAAVAQVFGAMGELSLLGWRKQPLVDANARLEPKLQNPALMEHPKRPDYLELFHHRDMAIRLLDRQAEPYLAAFAQAWQRLPTERQQAFREEPDWPNEGVAVVLARKVYAWFASGGYWMAARQEAPFLALLAGGWTLMALWGVST